MASPTLSICIVNWNTRELLRACLHSLYRYPPLEPFEVIVVDNAS
ncbi:MAG: glycosyltransferase, partial [Armatimonadota bacterium]|nr:glycosyltransferase [Armatimonadota bacterium]